MFTHTPLEGRHIRLEPLSKKHKNGLIEAIEDGQLYSLFFTLVPHPNDIEQFVDQALVMSQNQQGLAYTTISNETGRVLGSTRFMRADFSHKKSEIGFTFLRSSAQRTAANTEAKLLMLEYGFEKMNFNRIELLTDYLNQTSQKAILRLGAKQEGILRNDRVMPNGRIRDSVIFSILNNEWPGIQQNLRFKLQQYR